MNRYYIEALTRIITHLNQLRPGNLGHNRDFRSVIMRLWEAHHNTTAHNLKHKGRKMKHPNYDDVETYLLRRGIDERRALAVVVVYRTLRTEPWLGLARDLRQLAEA